MELRRHGHCHFIHVIAAGEVKRSMNVDTCGRPALRFKSIEEVYGAKDHRRFPDVSQARIKTEPEDSAFEPEFGSITLKQIRERCKATKRKRSDQAKGDSTVSPGDDELICNWMFKNHRRKVFSGKVDSDVDFHRLLADSEDIQPSKCVSSQECAAASHSGTPISQLPPCQINQEFDGFQPPEVEIVKAGDPEISDHPVQQISITKLSDHEITGKDCQDIVPIAECRNDYNRAFEQYSSGEWFFSPRPVIAISLAPSLRCPTRALCTAVASVLPSSESNNFAGDGWTLVAAVSASNPPFGRRSWDNNSDSDGGQEAVKDCVSTSLPWDFTELDQPKQLVPRRKIVSAYPRKNQLLDFSDFQMRSNGYLKHRMLKAEGLENIQPRGFHSVPEQAENNLSLSQSHGRIGVKKSAEERFCTGNTCIRGCSQKAISFSKRQMNDIKRLAVKLNKELSSMKDIMKETLQSMPSSTSPPNLNTDQIKSAIDNADRVEETSRKWLAMMTRDCNRFCKLMRSIEESSPTAPQKPRKRLKFADEVGGELCHVKYFEQDTGCCEIDENL